MGKYLKSGFLSLAAVLFVLTIPNYVTHAKTQLLFDRINSHLLSYVINEIPADSRLFMNIHTSNEYSERFQIYLDDHFDRGDIVYTNLGESQLESIHQDSGAFIMMPFIENQPRLTVRAGIEAFYQTQWNQQMLSKLDNQYEELLTMDGSINLFNINLPVLACPPIGDTGYCDPPDALIDTREMTYGWKVLRVK